MPARRVQFVQGHYYHVYNRGANRQRIFREEENYFYVLRLVQRYVPLLNVVVIAYCLMPNHYHFLLRQDGKAKAGLLMQRVFNSYVTAFNNRYGRRGTLFEGRFKAKLVEEDAYLLHLCRYIHANPVQAGLVEALAGWPFANYLEWVGLRNGSLVDRGFVQEWFPLPERYRAYVMDYVDGRVQVPDELRWYLDSLEE